MKKKLSCLQLIAMQSIVIIYSMATVMAKLAAKEELLSLKGFLFYGMYIGCLGIYAIFWQQMIRKIDLSVAYANRCMNLLWSSLFALVFFQERLSWQNIAGLLLVLTGAIFINTDSETKALPDSKEK